MADGDARLARVSRTVAHALRHRPDRYGLTLDAGGWTPVRALLDGLAVRGVRLTRAELERLVARDTKGRYAIETDRIRAQQGHSVAGVQAAVAATPPPVLFHGTPLANVAAIQRGGLRRRSRDVHLSRDVATARAVGSRRRAALGPAVVLRVDAAAARAAGVAFRLAGNGVWLTDGVPARFLHVVPDDGATPNDT